MKKALSVILTMLLMISILPTGLFSITASAVTSGYYTYTVSNGEVTITDVNTSISGNVTIPATLGGYPVTSIGDYAFWNCECLDSITIPDSVTSIGSYAFYNCSSLTAVTIPDSVTIIGNFSFGDCSSLTSVTIPEGVTSIGHSAFIDCSGITSVTIPNSVTIIGSFAFCGCTNLERITLPFVGSSRTANGTADAVFGHIFGYTGSLASDSHLSRRTQYYSYGGSAYHYYYIPSSLKSVTITDATQIPYGAFYNCSNLTSITIPNSVTSIGDYAFYNCSSLPSVTIPDSVTSIGSSAFYNCSSLPSVTIPDSVTSIGSSAFYNCISLTSVSLGDSVTSIGEDAFSGCTSLTSITIPNSVTSIGNSAFENCTSLTSITIPDSVTSIGERAFYGCNRLESITLPFVGSSRDASGTNDAVFGYIFGYTSSSDSGTTRQYYRSSSSYYYYYYIPSSIKSVTITDDPTIPYGAFYNCTSLTSVSLGDSVTSIGEDAFRGCTSLTSITIPDSITSIGNYAFRNCTSLTSITIPNSVTYIGIGAFRGCNRLESITLPFVGSSRDTYSAVFGDIFGYTSSSDSGTTRQYYGSSSSDYRYYYIPSSIKSVTITDDPTIPYGAFYNCTSLTSIIIPDSVTSIGSYAFYNCTKLTSVSLGDSVTSIGNSAFENCSAFTSVTIPNSVTSIDGSAFSGCTSLTSVSLGDSVKSIGGSAFYNCTSLEDVWYGGFKSEKKSIAVGSNNSCLTNANWHYKLCDSDHNYTLNGNCTCGSCGLSKAPVRPTLESKTNSSVTLMKTDGFEYSKDGTNWQTSNVFNNLSTSTTYTFYQRVKESTVAFESDASEGLSVTFKEEQASIPNAPIVSSFTDTTVTLIPVANCEYSKDGTTWQTSNVFDGLSSGTKYTFYLRYAETDTHEASIKSSGTSVTTDKSKQTLIPDAPTFQSFTASSITLNPVDGCEYSKDGTTWQMSNVFSGLSCGTEYTFYQRYKETATTYVGKSSAALVTRTDKGTQTAPSAPTLENKTHNSVTLTKISGCEYSRDGINWQTSNAFTGLTPETNYIFYQRKAENDRYYVSSSSSSLTVKTLEQPQYIPGDIDSTPGVTDRDAVYLLYHTFLSDIYPVNQDCDFNGDGEVNDKDAVYLLYYTFLPDLYPIN